MHACDLQSAGAFACKWSGCKIIIGEYCLRFFSRVHPVVLFDLRLERTQARYPLGVRALGDRDDVRAEDDRGLRGVRERLGQEAAEAT